MRQSTPGRFDFMAQGLCIIRAAKPIQHNSHGHTSARRTLKCLQDVSARAVKLENIRFEMNADLSMVYRIPQRGEQLDSVFQE